MLFSYLLWSNNCFSCTMKSFFTFSIFFFSIGLFSQSAISGNFSPAEDFKWLIAYELTPGGERYVADTSVKDGAFKLNMPLTAQPGIYRLVYAVPQEEYFIDIIYDKKEQVVFNFNLQEGLTIVNSEENKWYNNYFKKINAAQDELMNYYENNKNSKKEYHQLILNIKTIQELYEGKYINTIANTFIKANRSYLPKEFETIENLLQHRKQHHFDYLDITNTTLQSSSFLSDKISNYVFSALPLDINTEEKLASEIIKNCITVSGLIKNTPLPFKVKVLYQLWEIADVNSMTNVADYIFKDQLKDLAIANGNQKMVDDIMIASRLRMGALAPNISWQSNNEKHSLSAMEKAENYLLIFWSSTCSHCLKELPTLHKKLQDYSDIKIIAIGLEDDKTNWQKVSATLPNFNHAIALGKWESEYAETYNIQSTPTYFILDSEKRFIAKPESNEELIEFLEN